MRSFFTFVAIVAFTIGCRFSIAQEILRMKNIVIKGTLKASESNSLMSIRACRPWRVISAQTWLAGVLILLSFPNAFAESIFRHSGRNLNPRSLLAIKPRSQR